MQLADRQILAGRFELIEMVGAGGMATVFRARRLTDGTFVAIKILHEFYAQDHEFLARFEREAEAAADLDHPGVVRVVESGQDGGLPFMAMEFVDGEDLKQVLQREGALPPERAARVGAEVAAALAYAHGRGIIHRDIKPSNILFTHAGAVKVADFGVARAVSASTITQPGTVLGSVPYLSPEQARGDPAGAGSDLYSLGVVLFEMVTGRLPFEGETSVATALKHIQEMPPPPRSLNPGIPARLEGIILRALAKEPTERYPSAEVMRRDLEGGADFWQETATIALRVPPAAAPAPLPTAVRAAEPQPTPPVPPAAEPSTVPHPAQTRRRSLAPPLPALLMFGIFGLMLAGWLAAGPLALSSVVPDLRGQRVEAATSLLAERRLRLEVAGRQFSDQYAVNVIISHEPPTGARVARDGTIAVVISKGPQMVLVPDLRRSSVEEALAALGRLRLKVGRISVVYTNAAGGRTVLTQTPGPGVRVLPGSAVNLVVSEGLLPRGPKKPPREDPDDRPDRGRGAD